MPDKHTPLKLTPAIVASVAEEYRQLRSFSDAAATTPHKITPSIAQELTTARNQNLITKKEQQTLASAVVAFFGLSVGSHALSTWVMQSRARVVKIADFDVISATNLNRLDYSWQDIGKKKTAVAQARVRQMHPFIQVQTSAGTRFADNERLLTGEPRADIIVDAIDDFEGKIGLRKLARRYRLPLVSVADLGCNCMIDIERHDREPKYPFFHGKINGIETINFGELTPLEKKRLIIQLVGFEHNSERMLQSLLAIGTTIPTWPQLGATATMAGGVLTTIITKLLQGEKVTSGRKYLLLDELLEADYHSKQRVAERARLVQQAKQKFGL